ncbi:hypothetical protein 162285306 [Organic Lake phycodnavirus 1]|jgi:hypothetical protein|nr:hypothetical protein 162285306 [Organic Lake phycodnavirus 1]
MEYQKKYKVIAPPRRFHWSDEHIKLERKLKKDTRKRCLQKARWSKLNRDDPVKEHLTKNEVWDNYIQEMVDSGPLSLLKLVEN